MENYGAARQEVEQICNKPEANFYSSTIDNQFSYSTILIVSDWLLSYPSGNSALHATVRIGFTSYDPAVSLVNAKLYA